MHKPLTYKELHEFLKQNYPKLYFSDALVKAIEERKIDKRGESYYFGEKK